MPQASGSGRAWVDGRVSNLSEAAIPVSDRGFLFADSIYDTIRTYDGQPFLLGDHLDRLRQSGASLGIPVPWSDLDLEGVVGALLDGWAGEAVLRVVVTRGDGGHGLALPDPVEPRLVVLCRPLPAFPPAWYENGVPIGRPRKPLGKVASVPAHVKSGSYLSNVLALREVQSKGGVEALLAGADGSWAEATTSNLFLVRRGRLVTPGVDDHILPGITRALVLSLARESGLVVDERPILDGDLDEADELFLTSSLKEVLPVASLDDRALAPPCPGPVSLQLMSLFQEGVRRLSAEGASRMVEVFTS